MKDTPKRKFLTGSIFLYSIIIILIDQLTKVLIYKNLIPAQSIPVINSIFYITLVLNKGGAFGIFANAAVMFILISIGVILFIVIFLLTKKSAYNINVALACILGGAVSNLIDRLRFGCVVDFLDFRIWPVFNIADSAITLSAIWLFWKIVIKNNYNIK